MKRWISFIGHLVIIVVLTSFGKNIVAVEEVTLSRASLVNENLLVEFPKMELKEDYNDSSPIFLKKGFLGFKEAIAFKESQGKYNAVNTLGYLGKYQFGANTLKLMGVYK